MSIFQALGSAGQQAPAANGGIQGMMQRFNQFRQIFTGDPRQRVQELLDSGRVSQQQYNQALQMAQQFQRMLGIK